jgi:translation initiation factor IF-3
MSLAEKAELDLVQITPARNGNVPICKILDYGKYKYELSKRKKDQNRKQRESAVKTKEVKLRPTTDINDLKTKVRHANKFISDGCRVKVVVTFKGREMAHKHIGREKLDLFLDLVEPEFKVINEPSMDGKHMSTLIVANASKEVNTKAPQAKAS